METTPGIVNTPSIDIERIVQVIVDFLAGNADKVEPTLNTIFSILVVISIPVSLMLLIGIVYSIERLKVIRKLEDDIYNAKVVPAYVEKEKGDPALTNRWRKVLEHVDGPSQNDWRQAILEADIILDDILTKMGYQGASIGDKLKRVEKADFQSLDQAWEAHKVRNVIAHEGSDFAISQHEAKRIVGMYRVVFEEFFYI